MTATMSGGRWRLGVAAALVGALFAGQSPASSPTPSEADLQKLERSIEEHRSREDELRREQSRLRGEIDDLRARMIAAAQSVQRHEAAVTALEDEIAILDNTREEARHDLIGRHGQLNATLGALHRMARRPPEAVLAMPFSAEDTIRAAVVLRGTVPLLERESVALREEIDMLAQARAAVDARRAELATATRGLDRERVQLAALVDRRRGALDRAAEEERRVAGEVGRMASRAQSLRELLERLDAERRAREIAREAARRAEEARRLARREDDAARAAERASADARREARRQLEAQAEQPIRLAGLADARGRMIVPVQGKVIRQFGEGSGLKSQGIAFGARSGAQVVAPYDGRVSYAGEFRGYGLLLIIEHGDGYHTLLTGLSRLDVVPGQWLLAGEPVGAVGDSESDAPELYVEIRRRGQPVNPLPWLAVDRG